MKNKLVNNITIRLDDATSDQLKILSKKINLSRSEIIRLSLIDDLLKSSDKKTYTLTDNQYKNIIQAFGQVFEGFSTMNFELNQIGNNYNQIAKLKNLNNEFDDEPATRELKKELKQLSERVNQYWRLLV